MNETHFNFYACNMCLSQTVIISSDH